MTKTFTLKVCSSYAIYPDPGHRIGIPVLEVLDVVKITYKDGSHLVDVEIISNNVPLKLLKFQAAHNSQFQVEGTATPKDIFTFSACPLDANGYAISKLDDATYWVGIMTMKRGSEDSGGTWTGK